MTPTDAPDLPGLTFGVLDASVDEEGHPDRAALHGWGEALSRGFNESRPSDEHRDIWLSAVRADAMRLRGFWPEQTAVAAPTVPVATYASWTGGGLNVGGGRSVALHMITDVTVSPTHRRRGLLRTMMQHDLAAAAERGLALAALTVSEGGIYGRFGFGAATHLRSIEVDVSDKFQLRPFTNDGSLELIEPAEAWEALTSVFERHCATTRGALAWPAFYEPILTGRFDFNTGGPNKKARIVLHLDATGRPDGFALYEHAGEQEGRATLDVKGVVALTDAGYLRLWQFLAEVDLTERVRCRRSRLMDPLDWALVDPRVVRPTGGSDMLWLRVLDVVAALQARPWYADGTITLEIDDSLGLIDGAWQVEVTDGRAAVVRSERAADLSLTAETLGALYLGGVDTATLRAAGRITGDSETLGRWATMVDGGAAPYCTTGF